MNPRDEKIMEGVRRDINECRNADEPAMLETIGYEANDPDPKKDTQERLVHTVKWLAYHQVILNGKLRTITGWAWVFGISSVISMVFTIISVIIAAKQMP